MSEFRLPGDLTKLTARELAELKTAARAASDEILTRDTATAPFTMDDAAKLKGYEQAIRQIVDAETTLAQAEAAVAAEIGAARDSISAMLDTAPDQDAGDDTGTTADPQPAEPVAEPQLVTAGAQRGKTDVRDVLKKPTLNVKLRNIPDDPRGKRQPVGFSDEELIITAASTVGEYSSGSRFADLNAVSDAFHKQARRMAPSHGKPDYLTVASIQNQFEHVLSPDTPLNEVERIIKEISNPDKLWTTDSGGNITTAGGGFCSPSINRYQFFNIACEDGMIDIPTFGVERGGVNFPVSPSLADVFSGTFTSATNPWLWTETDDIATVTGAPNKPCVRVTCPSFTNVRLECYGYCLTAGNLTDSAYPEATQNHLKLLVSALYRAQNLRYLQQIQTLASQVVTGGAAGSGVIAPVLGAAELQAMDYRTRYGMCNDDVLDMVIPYWVLGAMRSDGAKRTGNDGELIGLTNRQLADWFDLRRIRAQFVSDYQVRGTGQIGAATPANAWPTTVDFMMWAPGTVVRGNGLVLDLGVVRDSVLNAENDFTAGWFEECHLIARFGHEIRRMTVPICTDGTTGAADLTACGL